MTGIADTTFDRTPGDAIAAFRGLRASPIPLTRTAATITMAAIVAMLAVHMAGRGRTIRGCGTARP